jgi:hypothetical protein
VIRRGERTFREGNPDRHRCPGPVGVDGQRYAVGGLDSRPRASGATSQKEGGDEKKGGGEATVEHG